MPCDQPSVIRISATLAAMSEVDDFLADVLPRLRTADVALHGGDARPRCALWSHEDPVTLFGAEASGSGWPDLQRTFEWVASRFTECRSLEFDVVAAGASGDLGYLVAIERITAHAHGSETSYALRVTTIFRREDGTWRPVHRHGDRYQEG
jgi:ketosteroid isomerase-like protein